MQHAKLLIRYWMHFASHSNLIGVCVSTSGKLPACEEDCLLGNWGEWQACSQSCGSDGVQERHRTVQHQGVAGVGLACAPTMEKRICLLEPCPT